MFLKQEASEAIMEVADFGEEEDGEVSLIPFLFFK